MHNNEGVPAQTPIPPDDVARVVNRPVMSPADFDWTDDADSHTFEADDE